MYDFEMGTYVYLQLTVNNFMEWNYIFGMDILH